MSMKRVSRTVTVQARPLPDGWLMRVPKRSRLLLETFRVGLAASSAAAVRTFRIFGARLLVAREDGVANPEAALPSVVAMEVETPSGTWMRSLTERTQQRRSRSVHGTRKLGSFCRKRAQKEVGQTVCPFPKKYTHDVHVHRSCLNII